MYYCICMIQLQSQDSKIYLANTDRHCSRKVPSPAETVAATDSQLTEAGTNGSQPLGCCLCGGVILEVLPSPMEWPHTLDVNAERDSQLSMFECFDGTSFTNVILCDNLGKLHVMEPS